MAGVTLLVAPRRMSAVWGVQDTLVARRRPRMVQAVRWWTEASHNTQCRTFPELLGLQVTSGQLAALGLPVAVMHLDASKLIDTYGKTWHFWQVDLGHELPMGERASQPVSQSVQILPAALQLAS